MAEGLCSTAMIFQESGAAIETNELFQLIKKEFLIDHIDSDSNENGVYALSFNGDIYGIGSMPYPIPAEEIRVAASQSFLYKNRKDTNHNAHIFVSAISSSGSIVENRLKLTRLVRSILQCVDAKGVYWGAANQIIQKDIFLELSNNISPNDLPVLIWVNFIAGKAFENKMNFYTTGLEDLGYPEYEVIDMKTNWAEAFDFLLQLIHDMLTRSTYLKDGDTVGRDQNEKFRVRYMRSEITDDPNVLRIFM